VAKRMPDKSMVYFQRVKSFLGNSLTDFRQAMWLWAKREMTGFRTSRCDVSPSAAVTSGAARRPMGPCVGEES